MSHTPQLYRLQAIIQTVCDYYRIRPDQMKRKDRRTKYRWARQVCAYFLRSIDQDGKAVWSYPIIAREIGLDTHATAIHCVTVVARDIITDPIRAKEIKEIDDALNYVTFSSGLTKEFKR